MSNTYGLHYQNERGQLRYTEFESPLSSADLVCQVQRAQVSRADVTLFDTNGVEYTIPAGSITSVKEV